MFAVGGCERSATTSERLVAKDLPIAGVNEKVSAIWARGFESVAGSCNKRGPGLDRAQPVILATVLI